MDATILSSLRKAIIGTVLFGIPVLLQVVPQQYLDLTIGGILVLIYSYFKAAATAQSGNPVKTIAAKLGSILP